ncbi:MAG: enhanced entry protein [uncultured bacterium]|nr:MAG: enhanced entry protein [uncultured bacterium]
MYIHRQWQNYFLLVCGVFLLSSCVNRSIQSQPSPAELASANLPLYHGQAPYSSSYDESRYLSRMPQSVNFGKERVILIDPKAYAWGAYDTDGQLVRAGIATSGADFCEDEGRPCRTSAGTFRIFSLGDETCVSKKYPLGEGGSLMPYCMFFNGGQSLHGSPDPMLVENNVSHGCVRLRIPDAAWIRYDFARMGTKVIVLPY